MVFVRVTGPNGRDSVSSGPNVSRRDGNAEWVVLFGVQRNLRIVGSPFQAHLVCICQDGLRSSLHASKRMYIRSWRITPIHPLLRVVLRLNGVDNTAHLNTGTRSTPRGRPASCYGVVRGFPFLWFDRWVRFSSTCFFPIFVAVSGVFRCADSSWVIWRRDEVPEWTPTEKDGSAMAIRILSANRAV